MRMRPAGSKIGDGKIASAPSGRELLHGSFRIAAAVTRHQQTRRATPPCKQSQVENHENRHQPSTTPPHRVPNHNNTTTIITTTCKRNWRLPTQNKEPLFFVFFLSFFLMSPLRLMEIISNTMRCLTVRCVIFFYFTV